ncbi:MAG: DUF4115 domain-containing protein [Candidatus Omnitrophica bacterium]|nr:DUF4115 domain-containing protein [Candidatus Omnitrophota bacterium]MDD5352827.1 DUF4115 domain-containing protein [Candidatus Omnitrophota bacterium]MDD5550426.1 DUF4115 domain-containing protein [Candidatus Omnitrophota bacterium]
MSSPVKPISIVLKEAREGKGISLEEAYKATKIHPKILHALEEGTTLGLSHVYVKSYIKIYAKFLGINRQELNKYLYPAMPKEKRIPLDASFTAKGEKIQSPSRLEILSNFHFPFKYLKNIMIFLIIFLLLVSIAQCFHRRIITPAEKVTAKKSLISVPRTEAANTKPKEKGILKESFPKINDILRLTIFAEGDTWMQVKVDGKVVFKRILKKSSSETWQAKESIELWLANAGIVKLELNGKILPPIGRRGQLLKSVLITREGININK